MQSLFQCTKMKLLEYLIVIGFWSTFFFSSHFLAVAKLSWHCIKALKKGLQKTFHPAKLIAIPTKKLGGGFKHFLFLPLTWERWSNLTCAYFSNGLVQPPTRKNNQKTHRFRSLPCLWDLASLRPLCESSRSRYFATAEHRRRWKKCRRSVHRRWKPCDKKNPEKEKAAFLSLGLGVIRKSYHDGFFYVCSFQ